MYDDNTTKTRHHLHLQYRIFIHNMFKHQDNHECDEIDAYAKRAYGIKAAEFSALCPKPLIEFHNNPENQCNCPLSEEEQKRIQDAKTASTINNLPMVLRECANAPPGAQDFRSRHIKCMCWCDPFYKIADR